MPAENVCPLSETSGCPAQATRKPSPLEPNQTRAASTDKCIGCATDRGVFVYCMKFWHKHAQRFFEARPSRSLFCVLNSLGLTLARRPFLQTEARRPV